MGIPLQKTGAVFITVWYGVGIAVILLVALGLTVAKRHLTSTKSRRDAEDQSARDLIARNAEQSGWGKPER